ncbi:hypothetical protein HS9_00549 [Bacillus velezensis]|nr:hypothetical protein HS9_00549 [Bacillus velezensis]RUS05630.1 hypothetical protein EFW58_01669 [Bacillus velezensis]
MGIIRRSCYVKLKQTKQVSLTWLKQFTLKIAYKNWSV